LKLLLL